MKHKTQILILFFGIVSSSATLCLAQNSIPHVAITFRQGSDILFDSYLNNKSQLAELSSIVSKYEDVILTGNGHIRLVANISSSQKDNLQVVNLNALRAAVISNYLKRQSRFLTKWNFSFFVNPTDSGNNTIDVFYLPSTISMDSPRGIFYTEDRNNLAAIRGAIKKYGGIPYLSGAKVIEDIPQLGYSTNEKATEAVAIVPIKSESNSKGELIAIYYRWDKFNLDTLYLSNHQNLHLLDSILTSNNAKYIDTLTIVAFASPEGNVKHNQDLSEWRAATIRDYVIVKYPSLPESRIITEARGENWQGVLKFAEADNALPQRQQVLDILRGNMTNEARQKALTALDGGTTYYRYILPNYYRYLRNGASILITYKPDIPKESEVIIKNPEYEVVVEHKPFIGIEIEPDEIPKYPIALRTNLLYDATGAANIGIEIPYGKNKNYSLIADIAYSYWRSTKNLYALQTLEYGVENRYWFGVSKKRQEQNTNWSQPLKGWYLGIYGKYWQRYDIQWIEGIQGDASWSVGLTAGYAIPLTRSLSFDFGVGAGWLSTSEYRHYHRPEYDESGKYHLMWQQTGSWSGLSLTKVRFALVWLIQTTKTQERRILP